MVWHPLSFFHIRQYYRLTADIDLSDYGEGWNNSKGWIPIGRGFLDYFDGDNHKVTGLYMNDDNLDFAGLFGAAFYGTIQNLSVDGKVVGRDFVGGLTGQVAYNGKIINCCVSGTVSGNESIGGLAGSIDGYSLNVTNCYTTNTVSGNEKVGGLVGSTNIGDITNCYATGAVSGKEMVGGVAGYVTSIWYSTATVSNVAWDGMLVNGSIVTSNDGSSIHGTDIDKVNAKTQLAYTDYSQFGLDWQFGNEDYSPWKMGVGDYPLPVFWWQTKEPTADITHLE